MKRIALAALQIRLSVNSRKDPPYLSVEFNQLDSPREVGGLLAIPFFLCCRLSLLVAPSLVVGCRALGVLMLVLAELESISDVLRSITSVWCVFVVTFCHILSHFIAS